MINLRVRAQRSATLSVIAAFLWVPGCSMLFDSGAAAVAQAQPPTTINVGTSVVLSSAKRLGVNLGGQNYYDSQQLMRNILFRNPGFEGETWQSILHCKTVTATSCTDDNPYANWYVNFFSNAVADFITGAASGQRVGVAGSTAAVPSTRTGTTVRFFTAPAGLAAGDYVVIRKARPGNAQAGWWPYLSNGAALATEFSDLSPNTPGTQALRINASGAGQYATLTSYADSSSQPFIQLNGNYTLFFRAKGTGGSNQVHVTFNRQGRSSPFFSQAITLTNAWKDYSFNVPCSDSGLPGYISLTFQIYGASMLLDDVSMTGDPAPGNPTVFRNEVVTTLQALQPGILRFMDSGTSFGSSIDNMLATPFARVRAGYTAWNTEEDDIPIGLHDFMVLCQTIGAEPWYTMPAGMSTQEMSNLMDYLGGSTGTTYGAKRAALGQSAPWTTVFPTIHLEYANEAWNGGFSGAAIQDAGSYGKRAGVLFGVARSSPSYASASFDLILDGWATSPGWNGGVLASSSNYDTIGAAPYLFYSFNDTTSTENIFGPMFAQPEALDSVSTGVMNQQAVVAASAATPANLAIYEVNLSTNTGAASQTAINQTVPSLGAGLAATEHMLLMMRDLGISNQAMFTIGGYGAPFSGTKAGAGNSTPLWGTVIDMGVTNRVRPTFVAEQLANTAILPTMLATTLTGANPTWNQPLSTNDNIQLNGAHYLQSFAFTDGSNNNLIVFNLHRTSALTVAITGPNAPLGAATITTLTAASISSSNEQSTNVAPTSTTQTLQAGSTLSLPPYSMTVISAAASGAPTIAGVAVSCGATTLGPGAGTTCSANVTGTGAFSSAVTWQVDQGSISTSGVYTAPASILTPGTATITATSVQDPTMSGSATITLASSTITSVSVNCAVSTLPQGKSTTCAASVQGTGSFSSAVTWSTSAGAIDANGKLTAPLSGNSVLVQATSIQDPSRIGAETIGLTPGPPILSVATISVTATTATISWTTNVPTRSGVNYGTTVRQGNTTPYVFPPTTTPSFTLTGLTPGTLYYIGLFSSSAADAQLSFASYILTTAP